MTEDPQVRVEMTAQRGSVLELVLCCALAFWIGFIATVAFAGSV